jgi:hypothetical protein
MTLRLFLGARLDHHDAVFVADDHDVDGGGGALGVGGIDDELAIHAAHAHRAHRGAEGNVGESQGAAAALMPTTSGSFSLSAEKTSAMTWVSLRKPSGKSGRMGRSIWRQVRTSFFAGPAFALDEAAGNASAGVGVLAVIHGEGEEVDAFPGIGRGNGGGQNDGFARGHQCGARGLLGHAAGLKDQPLAAGKLDGYFMLRHRVLVSFFSLGKLVGGMRRKGVKAAKLAARDAQQGARKEWAARGSGFSRPAVPGLHARAARSR